jgi:uncharacterized lipoprotein
VKKVRYLKFSFFVLIFLLVGCNTIRKLDKSDEYKQASAQGKSIILPSDTDVGAIEDHYPVPKVQNNVPVDVSILPPKSDVE